MTFTYLGDTYTLPDGLADIPVSQYAQWTSTYGAGLDNAYEAAMAISDKAERDLRLSLLFIDRVTKALSFYSTIPLEDVQQHIAIGQILSYIAATQLLVALEDRPMAIESSYEWDGSTWILNKPAVSDLTDYDSFLLAIDMAQKVLALAQGDWNAVSLLAAAYLRIPGESAPNSADVQLGSARELLMRTLPLSIALPFVRFITGSMTDFVNALNDYIVVT